MRVYFYLIAPSNDDASRALYKPHLLSLAEGLIGHGIEFRANIDWWKDETGEYVFKKTRESSDNFSVIVLGSEVFQANTQLPHFLTQSNNGKTNHQKTNHQKTNERPIIMFDWIASVFFSAATQKRLKLVDKYFYYSYSSEISECVRNNVIRPWPIGLTKRSIQYCENFSKPFTERTTHVLWAHRNGHPVRDYVYKNFYEKYFKASLVKYNDNFERGINNNSEIDNRYYQQTGRRHNPNFYAALGDSKIVDCCGGYFMSPHSKQQEKNNIRNWDNYKIWEGFAAGCCVITLDLDYYGFRLPHMPVNGVHYIGLRLDDLETTHKNFLSDCDIEKIAKEGKNWALNYYSPNAMASHFLKMLAEN